MAGTITKGTDGVLAITSGTNSVVEVPSLRSWTLQSSAQMNTENTRCMKSNSDGGSTQTGGWDSNILQGKNWQVEMEFFWQKDDEGASPYLDPTQAGNTVEVDLYPNDNTAGEKKYEGTGLVQSVSVPSQVGSNIMQTVTVVGDGALSVIDIPTA